MDLQEQKKAITDALGCMQYALETFNDFAKEDYSEKQMMFALGQLYSEILEKKTELQLAYQELRELNTKEK